MKKWRNLVLVLALMSVVSLVSFKIGENRVGDLIKPMSNGQLDLSLMWNVKDRLGKMFLEKDKMQDKTMVYGAIQGMVASLGDPYTVFLPPKENKSANEDLQGEFGGVGISLGYSKDGQLAVVSPLAKTPAERAGLRAGDLILKIVDKEKKIDKDTRGIALDEAVNLIRGKNGSEVTLNIFRDGAKQAFDVTMKRDSIVVPSTELVWKQTQGKTVAWVRLYKFSDRVYTEWPQMVDKIIAKKNEVGVGNFGGIVLDLRNNPGGFLQASVLVASDFVKDGVVVSQSNSDGSKEDYKVDPTRGKLLDEKIVVLINGGSASASEILAGALKDFKRAKLVGEKSFGKGTVQQPQDFSDGSGLHVTIAKWLLPSGKNIHKAGVDPDVEVKYVDQTPTGTPSTTGTPTPTPKDTNDRPDNQLDKAVEVLLKG